MPQLQQSLFSERQTRRQWLEKVVIPRFTREDGTTVRNTSHVKSLLRAIESFMSQPTSWTIAIGDLIQQTGVRSDRSISRFIKDAVHLDLLSVGRTPGGLNTYEINWTTIGEMILANPETAAVIDQSHRYSKRTYTPDKCAETPDKYDGTPDNCAPTPDKYDTATATSTLSSRTRSKPCLNHGSTNDKPSWEKQENATTRKSGHSGWPFEIQIEHLKHLRTVQTLWIHAFHKGWKFSHDHRIKFFLAARYVCVKHKSEPLRNPGGYFTQILKTGIETGKWPGSLDEQKLMEIALRSLDKNS